jgi:predicted negative regulator of RcsB-dependent stress response
MTEWADPNENPEQNAQYWRERNRNQTLFYLVVLVSFAAAMGYLAWQTHRTVQCITGEWTRIECKLTH